MVESVLFWGAMPGERDGGGVVTFYQLREMNMLKPELDIHVAPKVWGQADEELLPLAIWHKVGTKYFGEIPKKIPRIMKKEEIPLLVLWHIPWEYFPIIDKVRRIGGKVINWQTIHWQNDVLFMSEYLRKFDWWVPPTKYAANTLANIGGVDRNKMTVIPHGVDIDQFYPTDGVQFRNIIGARADQQIISFVGRCLPQNTFIQANYNILRVQDVIVNDEVLTKQGKNQKIKHCFSRPYNGEIISIKGHGLLPFDVTPKHEVYIATRKVKGCSNPHRREYSFTLDWKEAKDLKKKPIYQVMDNQDYLVFSKLKIEEDYIIDLNKYKIRHHKSFKQKFLLDENMAELLGLYLAEGYTTTEKVCFAFGSHEYSLINRTQFLIRRLFGKKSWLSKRKSTITVKFASKQLALFFKEHFGDKAINKKIPSFIMKGGKEVVRHFVLGYLGGDGCITGKERDVSFSTSSKYIPLQLQLLLSKIDVLALVHVCSEEHERMILGRKVRMRKSYNITISRAYKFRLLGYNKKKYRTMFGETKRYFFIPLQWIRRKQYKGIVYNFETEDNTYQISNVVIHNCQFTKGIVPLMMVARKLCNEYDCHIIFKAGVYNGVYKSKEIAHLLEKMRKWDKRIHFISRWANPAFMRVLFGGTNILICPSGHEGFSLPPLEAMACGVPVALTDIPVHRELIGGRSGRCGLLMPPSMHTEYVNDIQSVTVPDKDMIYGTLKYMLENPDECKAMGKNAIFRARLHYSLEKVSNDWLDLLERPMWDK